MRVDGFADDFDRLVQSSGPQQKFGGVQGIGRIVRRERQRPEGQCDGVLVLVERKFNS